MLTLKSNTLPLALSLLALFVAVGGGEVLADATTSAAKKISGKRIKKNSIPANRLTPAARRQLRGARGPAGPQGAAGPAGSIQAAAAGGDLTGSFPNPLIKPLAVLTGHIADNAVTAAKIQENAVGESELAANSVGASELQTDSVGFLELQPLSVLEGNIGANAVTSAKIDDGTITGADIATNAVSADKIPTGAIGSSEILDGTVGSGDLADGAVTTEKIAAFAVNSTRLASGSVSESKLLASGTHNPGNVQIPAEGCIEQTIDPPGNVQWTHALITARDIAFGGQQAAPGTIVQGIHPSTGDNIRLQLCTLSNSPVDAPVVDWAVL